MSHVIATYEKNPNVNGHKRFSSLILLHNTGEGMGESGEYEPYQVCTFLLGCCGQAIITRRFQGGKGRSSLPYIIHGREGITSTALQYPPPPFRRIHGEVSDDCLHSLAQNSECYAATTKQCLPGTLDKTPSLHTCSGLEFVPVGGFSRLSEVIAEVGNFQENSKLRLIQHVMISVFGSSQPLCCQNEMKRKKLKTLKGLYMIPYRACSTGTGSIRKIRKNMTFCS